MTEKNLTELRDIAKELGIKGVTKYKFTDTTGRNHRIIWRKQCRENYHDEMHFGFTSL